MEQSLAARPELLLVADTVARDKGIERDEVLEAMEQAIQKAGRSKYGQEYDIRAEIDRKSGEIRLMRFREVADPIENEATQMSLDDARAHDPAAQIGDFITDPLPPIDFGRIAAQTAKQVIVQRVRDAERQRQYKEFKDRIGEIVNGLVKRVEFGNVVVDLGRAEAMLRRDELLPRETFRQGERVRAYIYDVRPEIRGPQIFLSRTHPQFMAKLFAQEVPEIYDGIIEIRAVARDPGSRAKIGVISHDNSIDPVGACVGMRGSRVQAVVGELQGEKIDIIPWSSDPATFVVNALAPAEVAKVVMDEEQQRIEVVVPDDQLSLAIGRRGQNVRLASQLTGWDIDILTEAEESERRTEEVNSRSSMFIEALDVDDVIAHLLVNEGFTSVEEVAYVALDDLASIEGFDEDVAGELQARARNFLEEQNEMFERRRQELGVEDQLAELEGLTPAMVAKLGESGIKTLDDLADLAGDELIETLKDAVRLTEEQANTIIMAARAHWFEDEEAGPLPRARRADRRMSGRSRRRPAGRRCRTMTRKRPVRSGAASPRASGWPRKAMVRCAVDPEGVIVPDVAAALPGRGLWLTARRDIVALAIKKRAFDRAAKRSVKVPEDLADRVEALLAQRCRDGIGLARRSGHAVAGFEKVGQAMRSGHHGLAAGGVGRRREWQAETGRPGARARSHGGDRIGADGNGDWCGVRSGPCRACGHRSGCPGRPGPRRWGSVGRFSWHRCHAGRV